MSSPNVPGALFTDLYELTMAQAYVEAGLTGTATFSLFFRSYPPHRGYFVAAGLEDILDYLETFHFSEQDLHYLSGLDLFKEDFLQTLAGLRFTGSVRALPEGTIFFPGEPVLELTGPIVEAQIFETYLLNQANLQSILATKASRSVHAAGNKTLVDFGSRRAHGVDAADKLARACYLTGFAGTSNVQAGARYGIPVYGTMAHSFIMTFHREADAFRAYADSFPETTTLLVDTYDTVQGVRNAIGVAQRMKEAGHPLRAIRLDSGDLDGLAREARSLLDRAGLQEVTIFASGGLDELDVERLRKAGAPIDGFGIGTKLAVSADAPWTDCAYKLVDYEAEPVTKLSAGKQTLPGPKQVYRFFDSEGRPARDLISQREEPPPPGGTPLLEETMRKGRRAHPSPALSDVRERFAQGFSHLPDGVKDLRDPDRYPVHLSSALQELQSRTAEAARRRQGLGES